MDGNDHHDTILHIGTYTSPLPHVEGRAVGIHALRLDGRSGKLTSIGVTAEAVNPSYLATDARQRHLYAVRETPGDLMPAVAAFAIEPNGYGLRPLNHQPAHDTIPCFVTVDPSGRFVLDANYGSGSVSVYPIEADGRLGSATDIVQHEGSSVNPARQEGPHTHQVVFGPDGHTLFVPDLGLDRVMIYRLEAERGQLVAHDQPWVEVRPGAGPRHMVFHPSGRYAFLLNELDSTTVVFAHEAERLTPLQTISTLPAGYRGESSCAAIRIAPSGRFVYASNRGHDSIAIFAFDQATATLTLVDHQPTGGRTPRDFALDPSNGFLIAANQDSDTVASFRIEPETGSLEPTGSVVAVPNPVCVVPVRAPTDP